MKQNEVKAKNIILPILLVLTGLGTSIIFIFLFAELAEDMIETEVKIFDDKIIEFFHHIASDTLGQIMFIFTELGSIWIVTILSLLLILVLWWKKKDKWGILFFIIGIGGGGLLTKLLKYYYGRERPSINEEIDAIGYSFPSGHSMGSLIFYGFLTYFMIRSAYSKKLKVAALFLCGLLVVSIGISRIYLGAHYPSDVIAGYLAGAIWLILCILALEYVKWRSVRSVKPIKAFRKYLEHQFK